MSETEVTTTNDTSAKQPLQPGPPPRLHPHPDTAVPTIAPGAPTTGDAPRLGSSPISAPSLLSTAPPILPTAAAPTVEPTLPPSLPAANSAPATQTVHHDAPAEQRYADAAMQFDVATLPSLPQAGPAVSVFEASDQLTDTAPGETAATGEHPMAHLMPARSKPTEASIKAAELRAAKKSKAKKVKILVAIGALVVTALVGPPAVSWLTGAINEAGDTDTGE